MKCKSCGSDLADGARFCNACGQKSSEPAAAPFIPPTAPAPVTPPVPEPEPFMPEPPGGTETAPLPPKPVVSPGVIIAGIIGVAIVVAAVVLNSGGATSLGSQMADAAESTMQSTASDAGVEMPTEAASEQPVEASDTESYDVLVAAYDEAVSLGDRVGKARTDGVYGGTGFAYEVFNEKIGKRDGSVRAQLVKDCSALLKEIQTARSALESREVSDAYSDDKAAVVDLYRLLERRMEIMLEAAQVAVHNPEESNWRPILRPASTDARIAYQDAIEGARPTQH